MSKPSEFQVAGHKKNARMTALKTLQKNPMWTNEKPTFYKSEKNENTI